MKSYRSTRRSSRPSSSREWTGAQFSTADLPSSGGTAGWIIDPPTCLAQFESPTLIRLLVAVSARNQTTAPAGSNTVFGLGIYVATGDEDSAAVPGDFWEPVTDAPSDWVYRWMAPITANSPSAIYTNFGADIVIDVRTKRKIPRGAGILAAYQNFTVAGAGVAVDAISDIRCLLLSG